MVKQFLDIIGLTTFFNQLSGIFATKSDTTTLKEATDPYIFDVDYDTYLKFDTDYIISDDATSSEIGVGEVNYMIIASS